VQFCCLHTKVDDDALCANFKCAIRNLTVGELLTQNGHLYMLWQKYNEKVFKFIKKIKNFCFT